MLWTQTADDLQYTYDAYHRLLTIQNFNGEVYLSNQYDEYDRVIEQYVEGEGVFNLPMMEMPESIPVPGKMDIIRVLNMTLCIGSSPIPPTMAPNILNIMKKMNGKLHQPSGTYLAVWTRGKKAMLPATYPNGAAEYYEYDGNNLPVAMADRNGHTTRYERDNSGNITAATDGNRNTTHYRI